MKVKSITYKSEFYVYTHSIIFGLVCNDDTFVLNTLSHCEDGFTVREINKTDIF